MALFIERVVLVVIVGLILADLTTNPWNLSLTQRGTLAVALIIGAAIVVYAGRRLASGAVSTSSPLSPASPAPIAQRSLATEALMPGDVRIDQIEVANFFEQHTVAEGIRHYAPFINQFTTASGNVRDVTEHGTTCIYLPGSQLLDPDIWVHFRQDQRGRVGTLRKGETIKVRGRISQISHSHIELEDGEFVR